MYQFYMLFARFLFYCAKYRASRWCRILHDPIGYIRFVHISVLQEKLTLVVVFFCTLHRLQALLYIDSLLISVLKIGIVRVTS